MAKYPVSRPPYVKLKKEGVREHDSHSAFHECARKLPALTTLPGIDVLA